MNKTINYKNLEWYIIKETEKEKLLFLKECLTRIYIQKYFTDKSMLDKYFDVRFNEDKTSLWWEDSYIRKILNGPFLNDLFDINDLNLMKTKVKLNEEERTTEDYVRLITKEEVVNLPVEVGKTLKESGYFTMSPSHFGTGYAYMWSVCGSNKPNRLLNGAVSGTHGVRPVISLKSNNLITDIDESKTDLLKEMRRVIKL